MEGIRRREKQSIKKTKKRMLDFFISGYGWKFAKYFFFSGNYMGIV